MLLIYVFKLIYTEQSPLKIETNWFTTYPSVLIHLWGRAMDVDINVFLMRLNKKASPT